MGDNNVNNNSNDKLVEVISTAIKIPGVKVDRKEFLLTQFKNAESAIRDSIIEFGPVAAGIDRDTLKKMAVKLLNERTIASTGASFLAGLPGGLAMAATIPADMLQFYAVALRTAQEIAYLYGEPDLWKDGGVDDEKVRGQLILYCGAMFGASGAAQAVRVFSAQLAKQTLKKLPQKALTKTVYYPIVKSVCKFLGVHMTKGVFAKGVAKAVPVIGGVISGGITFATMRPMGMRLIDTLDDAQFAYTAKDFKEDWREIVVECEAAGEDVPDEIESIVRDSENPEENQTENVQQQQTSGVEVMTQIKQAKEMLDAGILTEDEFAALKAKLLS